MGHVRDVEQHVERALRRRQRVDAVPRHRPPLVGQHRHHHRRPVGDGLQRAPRVLGQLAHDRGRLEGPGRHYRLPGRHPLRLPVVGVADRDCVCVRRHLGHLRARHHLVSELRRDPFHQHAGSAHDVSRQAVAGRPHQREVADPLSGRDLLRLGRRARHGRPKQRVRVARHRPQPLRKRLVVPELQQPPARLGRRLALARRGRGAVARHRQPQASARLRQGHPLRRAQRQPQRVQLRPPAHHQPPVQLHRRQLPRHRRHLDAHVGAQPPRRRTWPREHVRAQVQPVGIARL